MLLPKNMVIIIVPTFRVVETVRWDKKSGAASTQEATGGGNYYATLCKEQTSIFILADVSLNTVLVSRAVWPSALRSL